MYFYGIDYTFLLVMFPFVFVTFVMHGYLTHTYFVYMRMYPECGLYGWQTARRILDNYGLQNVQVARSDGELSDHYDPKTKTILLSFDNYSGRGVSAIGVAAHEAGHAIQDSLDYTPFKIRHIVNRITNIGNNITIPIISLGVGLSFSYEFGIYITYIGVGIYALSTILQLVTLKAEYDASKRGLACLEADEILTPSEIPAAYCVMSCAALTNVVHLAVTIINFIIHRIVDIVTGERRVGHGHGGGHEHGSSHGSRHGSGHRGGHGSGRGRR
jgi:Zn-dependent membrane protease YugP